MSSKIVVTGYMIRHPVIGNIIAFAQYLSALHELGYQTVYFEESGWDDSCFHPLTGQYDNNPDEGLIMVQDVLEELSAPVPIYFYSRTEKCLKSGSSALDSAGDVDEMLQGADLLLNIGGVCDHPSFKSIPCRALIDMDPMFTQSGKFAKDIDRYDFLFSYGCNIGKPGCKVPVAKNLYWRPTVPPVDVRFWQKYSSTPKSGAAFTTLANWSAYGGVEYQGQWYGQKDIEFDKLTHLPEITKAKLELAVAGMDKETKLRFVTAGWEIRSSLELSSDLTSYCSYIGASLGEFSVAKHGYVASRSGWFSDRSVCYLACGKPVVLQDTGIDDWLERSDGVVLFNDVHSATESITKVTSNYPCHSLGAERLAKDVFGHTTVVEKLLNRCQLL